MLYIASALTPTPILGTLRLSSFTEAGSTSLIVAKPDKVEVWDVNASGLEWRTELSIWGNVISIAEAQLDDAPPHILVLTSPPNAQLLLLSYQSSPKPSLVVAASLSLIPPTPSLRQAEFCSKVASQGNVALISLWTGVISCVELEIEKDKDAKKRRSSTIGGGPQIVEGKRIIFRDNFNINIREHNLLDIAFLPAKAHINTPSVAYLWQSSSGAILLQYREVSLVAHALEEASQIVNILCPNSENIELEEPDFGDIPYSCPAARYILPIAYDQVLVMGDEYVVLYGVKVIPKSPKVSRSSFSSATGPAISPRASATGRSPQNEMSAPGKRRKGSNASRRLSGTGEKGELAPVFRARQGFGAILSYTLLDAKDNGASVVIGDECGNLTAYGWQVDSSSPSAWQRARVEVSKVDLGKTSPPSSLTYLGSSHLFVGSSFGDPQLVELDIAPRQGASPCSPNIGSPIIRKGKGRASISETRGEWDAQVTEDRGNFMIRERWMNLAPLRDFCVVEDEGGGVSHLVTASGASTSNSLRVIRSGVGLEETLCIPGLTDIQRLFSLRINNRDECLLLSTSANTHMVSLGADTAVVDLDATLSAFPTIAAVMLDGATAIHVNARAVSLCLCHDSMRVKAAWTAGNGEEIVAAAICTTLIVVAKRGGEVVVLTVGDGTIDTLTSQRIPNEVATVAVYHDRKVPSPIFAVSTWTKDILLYTLDHLQTMDPLITTLHEEYHAVSLHLRPNPESSTTSGVQLLAGLSDGTMVIHDIEQSVDGGGLESVGRKASSLGSRPLTLQPIDSFPHGEDSIIALGLTERLSIIFENKGRIDFSTVSKKDVTAVSALKMGGSDCIALASPSGLTFSRVTSLKKLSIQTLDMGNVSPTKLLSLSEPRVLAVGTTEREMDRESGDVIQRSRLEIRDSSTLEVLTKTSLDEREEVSCLSEAFLLGKRYVVVGTAIIDEDEGDEFTHGSLVNAKAGRIRLIEIRRVGDAWQNAIKASYDTVGPVHDIKIIHGFVAVAAGSKVSILRLDSAPFGFKEVSHFASTFIAQHLYIAPVSKLHAEERLVVGDGMRSIFVLEVDDGSGMIYADQRDLATHQVMALEGVQDGGQGVIIADGYSNILTLRLDEHIESAASFGLHEDVARFRHGSLVPPSSAPEVLSPELLYATTNGRLGIIGELTKGATKTLGDLQRNMDKYHHGPGEVEWKTWRRGGTELIKKETAGFIDGNFVQRFLDLEVDEQKVLFEGTNPHERLNKLSPDGRAVSADKGDVVGMLQAVAGLH